MAGCQNYGPFLGTLNIRGRTIIGTQKGQPPICNLNVNGIVGEGIFLLGKVMGGTPWPYARGFRFKLNTRVQGAEFRVQGFRA